MLVQFTVKNFRSFQGEQTLNLVASNYIKELPQNILQPDGVAGLKKSKLVRAAALYGANASGKSNLLKAMTFLKFMVVDSALGLKVDEPLDTQPFALSGENDPISCFEIEVIIDQQLHRYQLQTTPRHVVLERLERERIRTPEVLFQRTRKDNGEYAWEFSDKRKSELDLASKVRPNSTFVSTSAQWNGKLTAMFHSFMKDKLNVVHANHFKNLLPFETIRAFENKVIKKEQLLHFLQIADRTISDFQYDKKEESIDQFREKFPGVTLPKNTSDAAKVLRLEMETIRRKNDGTSWVSPFRQTESDGTTTLFSFIGPFFDVLANNKVLLVDEVESSLHPRLLMELIHFFQNTHPESTAQLVFTTHNPLLMEPEKFHYPEGLLRRDQIWMCEKNQQSATELIRLDEYSPRKGESLAKGYMTGRYGGVPVIPGHIADAVGWNHETKS